MSDVREQLRDVVYEAKNMGGGIGSYRIADAILERWDLAPKPVVTEQSLGGMIYHALRNADTHRGTTVRIEGMNFDSVGKRMLDQLDAAGLRIVKADDQ